MAQRYEVLHPREYVQADGTSHTYFTKVGVAFPARNGDGFDVQLYYVPPHSQVVKTDSTGKEVVEQVVRLIVRPPLEQQQGQAGTPQYQRRSPQPQQPRAYGGQRVQAPQQPAMDDVPADDIPF